jgi:hypothetical protein
LLEVPHGPLHRAAVPGPAWELGEGAAADPAALRALGDDLRARCDHAAAVVTALRARGWSCRVGHNELVAEKSCGRAAAMLDFLHADLDPVALTLEEAQQVDLGG